MPLTFVDIETTGSHLRFDRIIEIGILRVEDNKLIKTYNQLINPETYVSPFIEQITGIRQEDLEDKPTFDEIKDEIMEILDGSIFIAHNVRFDYGFIKNEFKRYGVEYSAKQLCTVKLSRALFPEYHHHNLDALIERYHFEIENRHRAFDDAKVLWMFYQTLHQMYPAEHLQKTIHTLMKRPSLPIHIKEEEIEQLPEGPGVYMFYGDQDIPLYIGKSINIRDRVLSHFSEDHTSSKELRITQQIKRIETIPTVGELGALLKEASMIKKHQPLYNHQLRQTKRVVMLKDQTDSNGYKTLVLEDTRKVTHEDLPTLLGIFPSRMKAKEFLRKKASDYSLCEKLLGLEKCSGSCFSFKLGKCKGACIEKEKPLAYNIRFVQAFSERRIKAWPYNGPIYINEYDPIEHKSEQFMVNKWCLITSPDDDLIFDYDTYKILVRYILNIRNQRNIKSIQTSMNDQEEIHEFDEMDTHY